MYEILIGNPLIFISQLCIVALTLLLFLDKRYKVEIFQCITFLFFILNFFCSFQMVLFGIHTTLVEPYGIGLYFLTVFLYRIDKNNITILIKNIYFNFILILILMLPFLYFFYLEKNIIFFNFIFNGIKSILLSITLYTIVLYLERIVFNYVIKYIPSPYAEGCTVSITQFFDTFFFTFLFFYHDSWDVIFQLFSVSYGIKLLCIIIYTLVLLFKNNDDTILKQ